MAGYSQSGISAYKKVSVHGGASEADPYQLICMLMDGALERLNLAKAAIQRNDKLTKTQVLHRVVEIIDELRASLNHKAGGQIAENLEKLYDYMIRRTLAANLQDDVKAIDEVNNLLSEIRNAWGSIPPAERIAKVAS